MHLTPLLARFVRNALWLTLIATLGLPVRAKDFQADARKWYDANAPVFEEANKLSLGGDTARGNKLLTDLADKDGGGVAAFMVANTLYGNDPVVSRRLHERAMKAFPNEPATILEVAMELHRQGNYAAAIPLYQKSIQSDLGEHLSCLLADCLMRTGRLKEAVKAWQEAKHGSNHTSIDFAIYEIYGKLRPAQRRGDLIAKIKSGSHDQLADLIELDLNFDTDWWNSSVFEEALDVDLKLAESLLGKQDPRYLQLALYAKLARQEDKKADDIRQALTAAKLVIGKDALLPKNSVLARALCELVVRHELATASALWDAHQATLRTRLAAKDRDALHLLCWLAANSEKRAEIETLDRLGWKEWQDPEFAVSYVADLAGTKKITKLDDPELAAALKALPEDGTLNSFRLQLAGENGMTKELLVAAIKSEYRKLSTGMAIPDSYTLKALFNELGKKL